MRPDELEDGAIAEREVAAGAVKDEVARPRPRASHADLELGPDPQGPEPLGVDARVDQPRTRDDVREPNGREIGVGLMVATERMLVDDAPEPVRVVTSITLNDAGVVELAPVDTVEVAVAQAIARDQLVERRQRLGRERLPVGERPSGLDELERGTKITDA